VTAASPIAIPGSPSPPDDHVRAEWAGRVEAAYRSATFTHHLTLWLLQLGAPHDLVRTGLRLVEDGLTHAELSADVYRAAGGLALPQLERDTLRLPRTADEPLERDLLRVVVEQTCLAKTLAVRILGSMQAQETVPAVRQTLERMLRDERVHRDFGWTLLDWLLAAPLSPIYRTQLQAELPAMLMKVREQHGGLLLEHHGEKTLESSDRELSESTRGWGMLSTLSRIAVVEEAFAEEFAPRFLALGIALSSSGS
jgi:hypothetical protein